MLGRIWRIFWYGGPLVLAAFFIPFGSDWVAVYVITGGVRGPLFFFLPCLAATLDMVFWNWFFGWSRERIVSARKVKEAIEEFKEDGLPSEFRFEAKQVKLFALRLWSWLTDYIDKSMNPSEGWRQSVLAKLLSITQHCPPPIAYGIISAIPIIPAVGMYIGIIVCRTVKLRRAFTVLLLANLAKTLTVMLIAYLAFR